MEKRDTSNKYSAKNDITKQNSPDTGIEPSRISDVHWSNTAKGQGDSGGTKLKGDGHNLGNINIYKNKITATKGESDVGMFIFHNINYNCKAAGGSSSAQGQGGGGGTKPKGDGYNIHDNNIKGDGVPKAYHNFDNFECNIRGSTNKFIMDNNQIKARNKASYVGMFNFHNVYINGRADDKENLGIRHEIKNNTIDAENSRKVGIQDFGNIKYNGRVESKLLDI